MNKLTDRLSYVRSAFISLARDPRHFIALNSRTRVYNTCYPRTRERSVYFSISFGSSSTRVAPNSICRVDWHMADAKRCRSDNPFTTASFPVRGPSGEAPRAAIRKYRSVRRHSKRAKRVVTGHIFEGVRNLQNFKHRGRFELKSCEKLDFSTNTKLFETSK